MVEASTTTSSPQQAAEKIRWLVGFETPMLKIEAAEYLFTVWGQINNDKPPLRIDGWLAAPVARA